LPLGDHRVCPEQVAAADRSRRGRDSRSIAKVIRVVTQPQERAGSYHSGLAHFEITAGKSWRLTELLAKTLGTLSHRHELRMWQSLNHPAKAAEAKPKKPNEAYYNIAGEPI